MKILYYLFVLLFSCFGLVGSGKDERDRETINGRQCMGLGICNIICINSVFFFADVGFLKWEVLVFLVEIYIYAILIFCVFLALDGMGWMGGCVG